MDKEQALEDFLKSLRTSLTNSSIYFKEHPVFLNSVQGLRDKIYDALKFFNPLGVGIAPRALFVEGKFYEKNSLYLDLAQYLHIRKVKNIIINDGVTADELISLLAVLAMPPRDIFKGGGLSALLATTGLPHIFIEELDYSELLKGEGQAYKDIWMALLESALKRADAANLNAFADNFDKITANFNIKDFTENPEVNVNIIKFFGYLKGQAKDKFNKCAKGLAKSFLVDKNLMNEDGFLKIMPLLDDLNEKEISEILDEELLNSERFDALSFQLFTKLVAKKNQPTIASALMHKLSANINTKPQLIKKLKELFLETPDSGVGQVYYHALLNFLRESEGQGGFLFDREILDKHYGNVLLNILFIENDKAGLQLTCAKLSQLLDKTGIFKDTEYLKNILYALETQRKNLPKNNEFEVLEKSISAAIEKAIIDGQHPIDADYFIRFIKESSFGLDFYINKIFAENKINQYILQLLFNLFYKNLGIFYDNLRKRSQDVKFLKSILEGLESSSSVTALAVLKYIFSFADGFIKIEALKTMQTISFMDKDFLIELIKKGDIFSKKQALLILAKDTSAKKKALSILLGIRNPFGIRNKLLLQNLRVIDEVPLKEAGSYLFALSRKGLFFTGEVKRYAQEILKKHDYGKD